MKVETNLHDGKATVLQLVYLSQEFENFQQKCYFINQFRKIGNYNF